MPSAPQPQAGARDIQPAPEPVARDAAAPASAEAIALEIVEPPASAEAAIDDNHIQRRFAARKLAREQERKKREAEEELERHLLERAMRAKPKAEIVEEPSVWAQAWTDLLALLKSKRFHHGLAYGALALMVGVVGYSGYQFNAEHVAAELRSRCEENNMTYASGSKVYCYDDRRFAHQITESGVAGRMNLDWKINERLLRMAIRAADRASAQAARPVELAAIADKPAGASPVVVKPAQIPAPVPPAVAEQADWAPDTVSDLAAQLMRTPKVY
ncbi:hypothetical protein M2322_002967 [Rhodoblastus acidophilus]|uniref:hypothetical protein n=1 Tax=Rhodoblastus acidophilus TaxID=1074 RepID=UPI0022243B2D|nr:hypothetical protein [Rhodoblastus acidophilus]MCW2317408.1 hypothetical protein [Rhodoblastus acidophilus]